MGGFRFCMKVLCISVRGAACNNSKGIVLSGLQSLKVSGRYDRRPNGARIFYDRKRYCLVGG